MSEVVPIERSAGPPTPTVYSIRFDVRDKLAFHLIRERGWRWLAALWEPAVGWAVKVKALIAWSGTIGFAISIPRIWDWLVAHPFMAGLGSVFVLVFLLLIAGRFKRASAFEHERRLTGREALLAVHIRLEKAVAFTARLDPLIQCELRLSNACPFHVRVILDTFSMSAGTSPTDLMRIASSEASRPIPIMSYGTSDRVRVEFPLRQEALGIVLPNHSYSCLAASMKYSIRIEREGMLIATEEAGTASGTLVFDTASLG
jgi:hypothetical protein